MMDRESRALHCADRRAPSHERNSLNGIEVTKARRRCCCMLGDGDGQLGGNIFSPVFDRHSLKRRCPPAARFLINVLHSVTVGKNVSLHLRGRKRDRRDGIRGCANPPRRRKILATLPGKRRSEIESQPWGPRSDKNTKPHRRLGRGEAGTYNP